jgi:ribonuclease BN (tRNA processing enzyme)
MKLTIAGSGDAFASGGRLNTCFHVRTGETGFLIDCGATALVSLKRAGFSTNDIDTIYISHLHGDHFGGLPFFLIDALFIAKRTKPLTLAGPAALEARFHIACEAMFPLVTENQREFDLTFAPLAAGETTKLGAVSVLPFEVKHYSGAPSYALRFALEDKVLAYSGDSGWTDTLIEAGRDADLYIMECFQYDKPLDMHLDYMTILRHLDDINAKQVLLTHMSDDLLAKREDVTHPRVTLAEDGMVLEL